MSYHPHLQLQVGSPGEGYPITTIPPEFLLGMTYKTVWGGLATLDFTVIDPTFDVVEELLITSDTRSLPIFARFGYLDDEDQISSNWIQARLMNYVPSFTTRGTAITASTLIDIKDKEVIIENKTYQGKVSRVVEQIAVDMDVDLEIEETDDDYNEVSEVSVLGKAEPRSWHVRNMTLTEVLRILAKRARSKSSQGSYEVTITPGRTMTRKPKLHFHTRDYPNCSLRSGKPTREFTYLVGRQDQVIEFAPNYSSSLLGLIGAGGLVMRTYDPQSKKWVTQVNNIVTNPDGKGVGEGNCSNAKPTGTTPTDDLKAGGIHIVRERNVKDAEARTKNLYTTLLAASYTASLTLVGLPELADLEANELIKIDVLIPNTREGLIPGSGKNPKYADSYKTHWSSGTYIITEAIHEIGNGYTINCQIQRDKLSVGAAVTKFAELTQ